MPRAMYTITIEGEMRDSKNRIVGIIGIVRIIGVDRLISISGITGIIIDVICVFVYPDNISNLTVVCSLWQSLVEISD